MARFALELRARLDIAPVSRGRAAFARDLAPRENEKSCARNESELVTMEEWMARSREGIEDCALVRKRAWSRRMITSQMERGLTFKHVRCCAAAPALHAKRRIAAALMAELAALLPRVTTLLQAATRSDDRVIACTPEPWAKAIASSGSQMRQPATAPRGRGRARRAPFQASDGHSTVPSSVTAAAAGTMQKGHRRAGAAVDCPRSGSSITSPPTAVMAVSGDV